MSKRRYWIAAGVTLAMLLSFGGCSSSSDKKEETSEVKQATVRTQGNAKKEESKPGTAKLSVNADTKVLDKTNDISEILYGIFLEDINFAVDGGLYAEKVKNRSFEYGGLATNSTKHGWNTTDNQNIILDRKSVV